MNLKKESGLPPILLYCCLYYKHQKCLDWSLFFLSINTVTNRQNLTAKYFLFSKKVYKPDFKKKNCQFKSQSNSNSLPVIFTFINRRVIPRQPLLFHDTYCYVQLYVFGILRRWARSPCTTTFFFCFAFMARVYNPILLRTAVTFSHLNFLWKSSIYKWIQGQIFTFWKKFN